MMVHFFALSFSQNLNFSDAKFKALILTSNSTNGIAKNSSGVSIKIDANNDGEIQASEAQNVVILDVKMDETQKINATTGEINYPYYFIHLPANISDALLFTNVEELYVSDAKNAMISYVNNSKIKKVICNNRWFTKEETFNGTYYETDFYPVDFTIDNCPSIVSMNDISASNHPSYIGQTIFRVKNNSQFNGALVLDDRLINELYFENINFTSININNSRALEKLSVPNINTLQSIKITNTQDSFAYNQEIDLIANNCTALQEIILDGDNYDSHSVYLKAINVNGCSALKKIKGLNATNINFSTAGLTNLEELDCAYYNRYLYTGHQDGFIYWGNVTAVNLSGLPKLKTFKAFNQKFSTINLLAAPALEYVDITNTTDNMSSLNVSNHTNLKTLLADLKYGNSSDFAFNLVDFNASNCTALVDLNIRYHHLKNINLQNCNKLTEFSHGSYFDGFNLETVNLKQCSALKNVGFSHTKLTTLELSDSPNLLTVSLDQNSLLKNIDIKNSANEELLIYDLETTAKICADDFQVSSLQTQYPNAMVSTCDAVLGTNDAQANNIQVYPIPAKDFVEIKTTQKIEKIEIFDMQGKILLQQNTNIGKINISKLPIGTYILKIKSDGKETIKKIIKN